MEGCFELQCNQVFIGMVTMQYQAQIDMVCIVHCPYCSVLVPSSLLFSHGMEMSIRYFWRTVFVCHIRISEADIQQNLKM